MYRIQSGILEDRTVDSAEGANDLAQVDAELITSLCLVGFVAGRLAAGHPLAFSWDPRKPADEQPTTEAAELIRGAVGARSNEVGATPAPDWEKGGLITGAAGSASASFVERRAQPSSEAAKALLRVASEDVNIGYQGPGAYTGLVDDPIGNRGSVSSTKRFNVPSNTFGQRWRPTTYSYGGHRGLSQNNHPWGLLNDGAAIEGMNADTWVSGGIVGYSHGMIQAIYDAVAEGPWCTPFEIAVGNTTKVASCLACTLFMYAAGYPPSSIHLGRADSWLPFYPVKPDTAQGPEYSMRLDEAIRCTNARWALECWQHISLGVSLAKANGFLSDVHAARLALLESELDRRPHDLWAAANLFLDALTVHAPMTERVRHAVHA